MALAPLLDLRPQLPAPAAIDHAPANIEAEQALLGILLYDNAAFERVEALTGAMFFEGFHGRLFDAIAEAVGKGRMAEPMLLAERFADDPAFIELGKVSYLADLVDRAPPAFNARDYAREIAETARRRDILRVGEEMAAIAKRPGALSTDDIIEHAESALYSLAETGAPSEGFRPFRTALDEAMDAASAAFERGGAVTGISTGLADLDRKLSGLQPSDLIIVAARPSMGKSALAANIAHAAAKAGHPTAFFSLEMSGLQVAMRLIADVAQVPSDAIRRGAIQPHDFARMRDARDILSVLPLQIDQTGAISIARIAARARRLKRATGLDLIVVDYLQLATVDGRRAGDNRVQEVSAITAGLKALAKELNVPVVALAQLSRQVESRDDKRPMLSDLRESGSIEQDADVVIFIYREAYYLGRAEPKEGSEKHVEWQERMERCRNIADLIIAKQRHGPIGTVKVHFDEALTKFSNLARDDRFAPYNPGVGG